MTWIAVDAGTSMIKTVLFNAAGEEIAVARRSTTILSPQTGWAEQNMEEVWRAVIATVREVAAGNREPLQCLVTTAQGDGCWLIDAADRPVGNAILWCDGRATEIIEVWRKDGLLDQMHRISGSVPYAGLASAILRWLQRYDAQRLAQARCLLTANGWVHSRLTGRSVADLSDACNPFGDKHTGTYSRELLALCGLADLAHLLPPIITGSHTLTTLSDAAADELGLDPLLPVAMAPYDIVSSAYGAGAVRHGHSCVILGTTLSSETIVSVEDVPIGSMGTLLALHDSYRLVAMPTLTGCAVLDWAAKLLSLKSIEQLEHLAEGATPALRSPLFLPYLSFAGERAPFLSAHAHGSFHGLTLATTASELSYAVYEGLSFVVRDCLEASGALAMQSSAEELRICGGGARSNLWCQLISDCTGRNVMRVHGSEIGARGAYLYGLYVTGTVDSVSEAAQHFVQPERVFTPDAVAQLRLDLRFRAFCQVRMHASEQWRGLGALR